MNQVVCNDLANFGNPAASSTSEDRGDPFVPNDAAFFRQDVINGTVWKLRFELNGLGVECPLRAKTVRRVL